MVAIDQRISSGVTGLDPLIEGGFKLGSINLIVGTAGSGKTTFALQFIIDGLKKGDPALFVTFEEKKKKLFEDALEFGWDLKIFEEQGLFKFLEYTPEQIKRVLVEGGGTIDALISEMSVKRLVIDSISSFALLFQDELTQAVQVGPDDLTSQLQFEVDAIILLYHFKKKGVRQRALEVLKMRGTKTTEKTVRLNIDSKGLTVDANEVVSL
jgi:KaiC/GvpD/RAD55 family RecA-like ATPase